MSNNNLLADRIEQAINKMFAHHAAHDSGMQNYALLFNPEKSEKWMIILFFDDGTRLKKALDNGFCYAAYQFLQDELMLIDKQLPVTIGFDTGQYPSNQMEYEQLSGKHNVTYDTSDNEKGQQQICSKCGHDWGKHKLSGYKMENNTIPLKGWMTCPEEGCFCFMTWDTPVTKKSK